MSVGRTNAAKVKLLRSAASALQHSRYVTFRKKLGAAVLSEQTRDALYSLIDRAVQDIQNYSFTSYAALDYGDEYGDYLKGLANECNTIGELFRDLNMNRFDLYSLGEALELHAGTWEDQRLETEHENAAAVASASSKSAS